MGAVAGVGRFGGGFALLVVLFILLIIIGASFWGFGGIRLRVWGFIKK